MIKWCRSQHRVEEQAKKAPETEIPGIPHFEQIVAPCHNNRLFQIINDIQTNFVNWSLFFSGEFERSFLTPKSIRDQLEKDTICHRMWPQLSMDSYSPSTWRDSIIQLWILDFSFPISRYKYVSNYWIHIYTWELEMKNPRFKAVWQGKKNECWMLIQKHLVLLWCKGSLQNFL